MCVTDTLTHNRVDIDDLDALYPAGEPLPESEPHELVRSDAAAVLRQHFAPSRRESAAGSRGRGGGAGSRERPATRTAAQPRLARGQPNPGPTRVATSNTHPPPAGPIGVYPHSCMRSSPPPRGLPPSRTRLTVSRHLVPAAPGCQMSRPCGSAWTPAGRFRLAVQRCDELRHRGCDGIPHQLGIHVVVLMHEEVAHTAGTDNGQCGVRGHEPV